MKKNILALIICFIFINLLAFNVYADEISLKDYNGTIFKPIIKNDEAYLPIRVFAENLGMEVSWIKDINTVHLKTNKYIPENLEELYLQNHNGNTFIKLDNRFLNIENIVNENGTIYVSFNDISRTMGKEIVWDGNTPKLYIRDKESNIDGLPINEVKDLDIFLDNKELEYKLSIVNGEVYFNIFDYSKADIKHRSGKFDKLKNIKSMFYIDDIGLFFIDSNKNAYKSTDIKFDNLGNEVQLISNFNSVVDIFNSENSVFFVCDNGFYYYEIETDTYRKMDYCKLPLKAKAKDIEIEMSFVGDIYLSDSVLNAYNYGGINAILDYKIQEKFKHSNITMVNQEFAFSNRGVKAEDKQYTFRINPMYSKIFTEMDIDIVTIANNHALDFGTVALIDSFETLDNIGIKYVGAGRNLDEAKSAEYFDIEGKKIAILGATRVIPVYNWNATSSEAGMLTTYDQTALVNEIKIARENSDYVVVYVHWGEEKAEKPEQYQRSLAKAYIDAGADIIIGSHPHVLQGIEYYNGKPIIYSLGNFMFYNNINSTAILNVIIDENNEIKIQLLPCKASNSKTYLIEDIKEKEKFYSYMEKISFGVKFDEEGFAIK